MKIVVVGGTGLIGSRLVALLRKRGQDVLVATPDSGIDVLTGTGLQQALQGADVVVDLANSPSLEGDAALKFFETAGRNLLAAEQAANTGHHVALSIVGADLLPDSGYLRAKVAQERIIKESGRPYTILRSTQFFEFLDRIAESLRDGNVVKAPPALIQPICADDVVAVLADIVLGPPANATFEVAGPESQPLDSLIRNLFGVKHDSRRVMSDPHARYFGTELGRESLLPSGPEVRLGQTSLSQWLQRSTAVAAVRVAG